jgi:pimeloyl-ACP methyl ester carboxylesterase
MLAYRTTGSDGPTIVLLHWLGGSAQTWTDVAALLASRGIRSVAIDLPGFGDSVDNQNYSVQSMAEEVAATLLSLEPAILSDGWLLGGHSMGGKVAVVLARALLNGTSKLFMPAGLVLISPSPAGPEPMKTAKREQMLAALGQSTGDAQEDRKRAASFVDDNVGKVPLESDTRTRTVNDVLRMSRHAFTAWLSGTDGQPAGSKEDWSVRVGILPIPAIVFAGTEDDALGPDAQRNHTLPHLSSVELVPLQGCGHLGPIERPNEVADHIVSFAQAHDLIVRPSGDTISPVFRQLIDFPRTSPLTRAVLLTRTTESFNPSQTLSETELRTLRVLIDTVVPGAPSNLAARLDQALAKPQADGWRFDNLPADVEAWHQGLLSLDAAAHREHGVSFIALPPRLRRALLLEAQGGKLSRGALGALHVGESAGAFTAAQMQHWFEDVRAELTRLYVSDPRTLDRIGFTGFADDPSGFTQIRLEAQQKIPEEITESTR